MKILIIGGYSHGNPGDEAILKATVYQLQELFPSIALGIWTGDPDFKVKFDRPVNYEIIHWRPLPWVYKKTWWSQIIIKLYTDGYPLSKKIAKWFNRFDKKNYKSFADFDKVVFVGGGYLNSNYCLLEMNYLASFMFRLGKPIYFLGQTLGPFEKIAHQKMAREIFNTAEKIVLRDSQSGQEALDFKNKIRYDVDDAVTLDPKLSPEDKVVVDRLFLSLNSSPTFFLGINLRNWAGSRQYYPEIAKSIESFARFFTAGRLKLIFIPMEISCFCDDRKESKEFLKYLSPSIDYISPSENFSVEQKFYLISRLDLMIGMRFHSLAFALSNAVPTIGLYQGEYYFRKISGLFDAFGVGHHMLLIDKIGRLELLIRMAAANKRSMRALLLERKSMILRNKQVLLESLIKEKKDVSLKISVIIPTMNRVKDLKTALDSVMRQSYLPAEIILVDQSVNEDTRALVKTMALEHAGKEIDFKYILQEEKSLVKARNRGLAHATGDLVSFLDDDIVLFSDYFEQVVRCFKMDPNIGGISGNTVIKDKLSGLKWAIRKTIMRTFLLSDFKGRMTASGFGYPIYERQIEKLTTVEFMPGCNMNFRRPLIQNEKFDEWFMGYSFREDADFSYRISKKTTITMIPEAKLYHNYSTQNRLDAGALKKMEMRNYYYCFKKYKGHSALSMLLFMFSLQGLILIDFVEFLTSWKPAKFSKLRASVTSTMNLAATSSVDSQ